MAPRKPFLLRLRPEMLEALQSWAADEFRSLNGQLEYLLDQALREAGRASHRVPPGAPPRDAAVEEDGADEGGAADADR